MSGVLFAGDWVRICFALVNLCARAVDLVLQACGLARAAGQSGHYNNAGQQAHVHHDPDEAERELFVAVAHVGAADQRQRLRFHPFLPHEVKSRLQVLELVDAQLS